MKKAHTIWHRLKKFRPSSGRSPAKSKGPKITVQLPARITTRPSGYLAVTVMVKNEGRYLCEWIEFQRLMGVEHIYLYDNGSTDCTVEVLRPFAAEGFVTVIPWITFDDEVSPQRQAYAHALCNFGPQYRWMAFVDLDEFLFPVTAPDLAAVLSNYEDCPSICVPWYMFGTSGHKGPPSGLVIESYTERALFPPPPRRMKLLKWKSIVDPSQVVAVGNVHLFDLASGVTGGVDERRCPISDEAEDGEREPPSGAVLRINHYYTRSHQEFVVKLNAVRFTTGASTHKGHPDPSHRQRVRDLIEEELVQDYTIWRFLPPLYRRLGMIGPEPDQVYTDTTLAPTDATCA
jgi:Glycosyltransferase family 92